MSDGALLLGGCDALIGFLHKEITTELMKSVCSRNTSAGYTPPFPVVTIICDPRLASSCSSTVVRPILLLPKPFYGPAATFGSVLI